MKTILHHVAVQNVVERQKRHALMMHHEGANHDAALAFGNTGAREIDTLVKAVRAARTKNFQSLQVVQRTARIDHQRETTRIGRDHEIVFQSAFQPQSWNAKRVILIGFRDVECGISGFGNAPRNATFAPIFDLAFNRDATRMIEQRVRVHFRQKRRHQVLEHGAAPTQNGGTTAPTVRAENAAQLQPMFGGHIAIGNRRERRQTAFAGDQVIIRFIELHRIDV